MFQLFNRYSVLSFPDKFNITSIILCEEFSLTDFLRVVHLLEKVRIINFDF